MTAAASVDPLLVIEGLKVRFLQPSGAIDAVDGVDLDIGQGESVCLVGESGCGKSVTAKAIVQLLGANAQIAGSVTYYGRGDPEELTHLDRHGAELRSIRGAEIAMVFQEPLASLSPIHTIGAQIDEVTLIHRDQRGPIRRADRRAARERTLELLDRVRLPNPKQMRTKYPFELSGGMRQRAMIAMALAARPNLLIADEPTTALDVTTQSRILDLLADLQRDLGMAMLFITHDLGIVAEIADRVAVMYAGRIVETAPVMNLFDAAAHPYSRALLASRPRRGAAPRPISGSVPAPDDRPSGCAFHPRCPDFIAKRCDRVEPAITQIGANHQVRCELYTSDAGAVAEPA